VSSPVSTEMSDQEMSNS